VRHFKFGVRSAELAKKPVFALIPAYSRLFPHIGMQIVERAEIAVFECAAWRRIISSVVMGAWREKNQT